MKKLIILIVAVLLNAKIVTDSLNRKVNIPDDVKRAVAIGPGALRLVVYIKAEDKIVGIEEKEKNLFTPNLIF